MYPKLYGILVIKRLPLILCGKEEFNLHKICIELTHRRQDYVLVHPEFYGRNFDFTVNVARSGRSTARIVSTNGASFAPEDVSSVWTRGIHYSGFRQPRSNSNSNFILHEHKYSFNYLLSQMRSAFWINPIPAITATNRLVQADVAKSVGYQVPQSIVTSSKQDLLDFLNLHGRCIIKPICQVGRHESGPKQVLTSIISRDANIPERLSAPVLVQEFVEKAYEIRAVVVEDRVFAGAIDSMSRPETSVDSRAWTNTSLSYYRLALTEEECSMLRLINERLGLIYSAIDLIRHPSGDLIFLEANPSGQWTFLEAQTGHPITESIVDCLVR